MAVLVLAREYDIGESEFYARDDGVMGEALSVGARMLSDARWRY